MISQQITPLSDRFDPDKHPYAFVIPDIEPVYGAGMRAEECGKCHQTIYNEWRNSTHATALQDIQYQSELTKPDSPKWLCLNCHLPLQRQHESSISHLQDNDIFRPVKKRNSNFDSALQKEAITCAVCHVRPDEELGKTTIIGPNGSKSSPHPVRKDRAFLRNICLRCHDPHGEPLTPNLICWFFTKEELEEGQESLAALTGREMDCVDCHMPETTRLLAEDYSSLEPRNVNQHHWVGSGVPKWYEQYDNLIERGYQSGLDVAVGEMAPIPGSDSLFLSISLKNARSGHYLPTGDPERFILAMVRLEDTAGQSLFERRLRIGQTWVWNPAQKIGDNRLKQGETLVWPIRLPNSESSEEDRISVVIYHVRLTSENAQYIMKAKEVNETYLPNGTHLVSNINDYYPFASIIYREDIDLQTGARRIFSPEELIELSKLERGKASEERDY